jgi:hypothetical protein
MTRVEEIHPIIADVFQVNESTGTFRDKLNRSAVPSALRTDTKTHNLLVWSLCHFTTLQNIPALIIVVHLGTEGAILTVGVCLHGKDERLLKFNGVTLKLKEFVTRHWVATSVFDSVVWAHLLKTMQQPLSNY